ncbi:MAG: hypothetical protein ACI8XB_000725 [Patiriisocius sp.]
MACSPAPNPNPIHGTSYWIQYDLGETYSLGQTHFWNINDPAHRNYWLRNVTIDYSMDGITWSNHGDFFLFQGTGLSSYSGVDGSDLNELEARYILITAIDNWGGSCYGRSELRIYIDNSFSVITDLNTNCLTVEIYPNPVITTAAMVVASDCRTPVKYEIKNVLGSAITIVIIGIIDVKTKIALEVEDLIPAFYFITVNQLSSTVTKQIIVL